MMRKILIAQIAAIPWLLSPVRAECTPEQLKLAMPLDAAVPALTKARSAKGEFETTAAYQARAAQVASDVFAELGIDGEHFAVWLPVWQAPRYNADTRTFDCDFTTMKGSFTGKFGEDGGVEWYLEGSRQTKPLGSYTATNAYGVSKEISKSLEHSTGLLLKRPQLDCW